MTFIARATMIYMQIKMAPRTCRRFMNKSAHCHGSVTKSDIIIDVDPEVMKCM